MSTQTTDVSQPLAASPKLGRLRDFVISFAQLLSTDPAEPVVLERGASLLAALVRHDDWLPETYAEHDPARYRQYLLHCDSLQRFSVVSFVWGPSQCTPVHNHTVWGLVGVLRGAELNEAFERDAAGELQPRGRSERLLPGAVTTVSPSVGDIHRVSNAYADRVSISIHVYGANIGAVQRATFDAAGQPKPFVSGYANTTLPNLWDRAGAA